MVSCLGGLANAFVVNAFNHLVEFLLKALPENLDGNLLVGKLDLSFLLGGLSHEYRLLTGPLQQR